MFPCNTLPTPPACIEHWCRDLMEPAATHRRFAALGTYSCARTHACTLNVFGSSLVLAVAALVLAILAYTRAAKTKAD